MHSARRRAGHDCVHKDHIIIRSPSLDERERITSVNFGFEPQFPKPPRDHNAGLIISAMPIPTADNLHIEDLYSIEQAPANSSHSSRSICSFKKWVAQEIHGS